MLLSSLFRLPNNSKFFEKTKRYCCCCQFADWYSFHSLHETKKNATRLEALYCEILDDIEILKLYKDVNQTVLDFDIFDPPCYTSNLNQGEKLNQLKDFLLIEKVLILFILFTISETFFICLISFVCGYCVGYYFYDFVKAKKPCRRNFTIFLKL